MSGDALLVASLFARTVQAALEAALKGDPATAAQLYAAATAGNPERTLRAQTTTPLSSAVSTLTLAISRDGIGIRVEDPLPADATLTGPTTALLSLLRDPSQLGVRADVECTGDSAFALHVLTLLRALRPDPLLPLAELVGPGLPSALHTARAAATGLAGSAFAALREFTARGNPFTAGNPFTRGGTPADASPPGTADATRNAKDPSAPPRQDDGHGAA